MKNIEEQIDDFIWVNFFIKITNVKYYSYLTLDRLFETMFLEIENSLDERL